MKTYNSTLYSAHASDGNGTFTFRKNEKVKGSELEAKGFELTHIGTRGKHLLAVRDECHQRMIVEPVGSETEDPAYRILRTFTDGREWHPKLKCPVHKTRVVRAFGNYHWA